MASQEMKDAAKAVRDARKPGYSETERQLNEARVEIERLRQQLEMRGPDTIILERHGNDIWKGVAVEYVDGFDEYGDPTTIPQNKRERPNTFRIRPKKSITQQEQLEAAAAGVPGIAVQPGA